MDLPPQLQALDRADLTPLVRQVLRNDSVAPVDWHVVPYGAGGTRSVYRVAGSAHDRHGTRVPWSLILKVARADGSDDPSGRSYWKREMLAYRSGLLDHLPGGLTAPRCFGIVEQPGGEGWLWLEEIADASAGRWPLARFVTVARHLGAFSAAYLDGPLPAYPWLSRGWFRGHVTGIPDVVSSFPLLIDHPLLRPAMPGDIARRVLQVVDELETFLAALDALPQTFCHLDAFPRNLFVRGEGNKNVSIVAIDWEFAGVSALGADLAPLVGGSLFLNEIDLARADELDEAVFASYLGALRAAGWQGDQDLVRLGYAAALVLHYVFLVLSGVVKGTSSEDWRRFVEQMHNRPYMAELERLAIYLRFILVRADEARQILRSTRP